MRRGSLLTSARRSLLPGAWFLNGESIKGRGAHQLSILPEEREKRSDRRRRLQERRVREGKCEARTLCTLSFLYCNLRRVEGKCTGECQRSPCPSGHFPSRVYKEAAKNATTVLDREKRVKKKSTRFPQRKWAKTTNNKGLARAARSRAHFPSTLRVEGKCNGSTLSFSLRSKESGRPLASRVSAENFFHEKK